MRVSLSNRLSQWNWSGYPCVQFRWWWLLTSMSGCRASRQTSWISLQGDIRTWTGVIFLILCVKVFLYNGYKKEGQIQNRHLIYIYIDTGLHQVITPVYCSFDPKYLCLLQSVFQKHVETCLSPTNTYASTVQLGGTRLVSCYVQ